MLNHSLASRGWTTLARILLLAGAVFCVNSSQAYTNLYSTRFEPSEGYDLGFELIGQNGWVTDSLSYGGNGLLTNFVGSQAAYIGLFPLEPADDYLALWQPINFAPLQTPHPIVTFSVLMSIVDSSTTNRDDFYWSLYNMDGDSLFTLDFYNGDLGIYYALDNTNVLRYSGVDFTNDVTYQLTVTMDFQRNRWYATLGNRTIVTNVPISGAGKPLTLGDMDALWIPAIPSRPGDNYMIFDNYQLTAHIAPNTSPTLISLGTNANRQYSLRLHGSPGTRYAIESSTNLTQWTALRTNVATNGVFDFTDTASAGLSRRSYRGRLVR